MAKTTITVLTDDIDGGDADETIFFALEGKNYEIDLSKKNAETLRKALDIYVSKARTAGRSSTPGRQVRTSRSSGAPTLFSQLAVEERDRFRAWAQMPTARRIGDARVKDWIEAGKP